jgi:uncharacterized protein YdeI (BOF family)
MLIHRRIHNRKEDRMLVAQGAAALLAFSLMLVVAARGIQSQPDVQAQQSQVQVSGQARDLAVSQTSGVSAKSVVLVGTVVKDGEVLVFREQSGKVYHMKEQAKARPFVDKPVKVTGRVDDASGMLILEKIESAPA